MQERLPSYLCMLIILAAAAVPGYPMEYTTDQIKACSIPTGYLILERFAPTALNVELTQQALQVMKSSIPGMISFTAD